MQFIGGWDKIGGGKNETSLLRCHQSILQPCRLHDVGVHQQLHPKECCNEPPGTGEFSMFENATTTCLKQVEGLRIVADWSKKCRLEPAKWWKWWSQTLKARQCGIYDASLYGALSWPRKSLLQAGRTLWGLWNWWGEQSCDAKSRASWGRSWAQPPRGL